MPVRVRSRSRTNLKCPSCALDFKHRSSLSRHLRKTCGRRQELGQRQKSCSQCAAAKSRCSLNRPKCERCKIKGVSCQYYTRRLHSIDHDEERGGLVEQPSIIASSSNSFVEPNFVEPIGIACRTRSSGNHFVSQPERPEVDSSVVQTNTDYINPLELIANGPTPSNIPTFFTSAVTGHSRGRIQRIPHPNLFAIADIEPPSAPVSLDDSPVDDILASIDTTSIFNCSPSSDAHVLLNSAQLFPNSSMFWPSGVYSKKGPGSSLVYNSMELILRVLRSWPGMLVDELQYPPLFHHTQLPIIGDRTASSPLSEPLANCITLTNMWYRQQLGAEELVQETILGEVDTLLKGFPTSDESTRLCTLQVLVIYTILILSPSKGWRSASSVDAALFSRIKYTVQSVIGEELYPQEERDAQLNPHPRFGWHEWIRVTAKRRAVLSLYLLHWAYSMYHGVQSFDCRELSFMPAPAPKMLWQAHTERQWNALYSRWLVKWKGKQFLQGEFEAINNGIVLGERADRWLRDVDEFGFIMMAIVNATDFQKITTV